MMRFQFVPQAVPILCQLLMAGYGAVYLATIRRKARATRWLIAALVGLTLYSVCYLGTTLAAFESPWSARFSVLLYLMMQGAILALVGFAYTFLARPFRREARVAGVVGGLAWGAMAVWTAVTLAGPAPSAYAPIVDVFGLGLLVGAAWALATFARQAARFRRLSCMSPCRCYRRQAFSLAHGTFVALTALLLGLAVMNALASRDLIPFNLFQYVVLAGSLAFSFGLVVAFLNYASEPTTVQAKLVALGLAVVLLVLGMAGLELLVPSELAGDAGNGLGPAQALRFEPQGAGGYTVRAVAPALRDTTGRPLPPTGSAVPLPFPFRFAGATYRTVYLSSCTLGLFAPPDGPETALPRIAAFLRPCYGGSPAARRVAVNAGGVVITWFNDEIGGGRGTSQLALFPDGAFEVAYRGPRQAPIAGGVGFSPGRGAPEADFLLTNASARVGPGRGLMHSYSALYRAQAHRRTLPLIRLVLAASAFVLVFFPLFLRAGLLRPLAALTAGVRRLDAGDLSVRVPPRANDELDVLARSFNRMAVSVRDAQEELRTYVGSLETRVAERTADLAEKSAALEDQSHTLERSLDELRAAQARLVQSEKLAGLGRLTAGIAHEIKNPLNFVNNFAGLNVELTDELANALGPAARGETAALLADLRQNATKIREHGQRADRILRGMQLHARGASAERAETELAPLLLLAADATEEAFQQRHPGAGLRIARELAPDLGWALVAPEGLVQVVVNLLDNALDAVHRGGAQSGGDGSAPLTAGAPAAGGAPVLLRATREGGRVVIRVEDRGPGMDDATRARAFEPFYTTKPAGEGTGLGLSLAYDVVTAGHGGTLEAASTPGRGSTFTVSLPAE